MQEQQLDLFAARKAKRGEADTAALIALLADGKLRTRSEIATALSWSERQVRDCAEHATGQVARAPGVAGYTLATLLTVEQWHAYRARWISQIKQMGKAMLQMERVVYGKKVENKS